MQKPYFHIKYILKKRVYANKINFNIIKLATEGYLFQALIVLIKGHPAYKIEQNYQHRAIKNLGYLWLILATLQWLRGVLAVESKKLLIEQQSTPIDLKQTLITHIMQILVGLRLLGLNQLCLQLRISNKNKIQNYQAQNLQKLSELLKQSDKRSKYLKIFNQNLIGDKTQVYQSHKFLIKQKSELQCYLSL